MTTKRKATGVIKHTFRSAYNKGNEKYSHDFPNGITEQYHNDSCDINQILAQFMETGIMPPTNQRTPNYMDVSENRFSNHAKPISKREIIIRTTAGTCEGELRQ